MIILPAIDLINGQCVRLFKGDFNQKKIYSLNPIEVAQKWKSIGAQWLHIIDLDGAKTGNPKNIHIAKKIKDVTNLRIEFGGGIRDKQTLIKIINLGFDRVITGIWVAEDLTLLVYLNKYYNKRFIISVDFDNEGYIYRNGWQTKTNYYVFEYLKFLKENGIEEVIITNISRDGTLKGVNLDIVKKLIKNVDIKIIIAGGVSGFQDIIEIKNLNSENISGVVIGKALYEGKIDLRQALLTLNINAEINKKNQG